MTSEPFFQSLAHPHLTMNRYGIVFAPNGHADGVDYWGKSCLIVPLRRGLLNLESQVQDEARASGYTMQHIGDCEVLFTAPETPST